MASFFRQKAHNFRKATASREAFVEYCEAPPPKGEARIDYKTDARARWTNLDLAPSPPQDRSWTQWTYLAWWMSMAASTGQWTAGSSLISIGCPPLDAYLALVFSHIVLVALIIINGRGPARYHIGFPVFARTTFGMWGSYMAVAMRAVVCIIWNGTNSYYGGKCVAVALTAVWPNFGTMTNHLPASAGITSRDLLAFFVFMFMFTAISFVHTRDLQKFYHFKAVYCFSCLWIMFIWFMVKAGGVSWSRIDKKLDYDTYTRAWLVLRAFNSGIGSASSLTVNQGDMTRYADKPSSAIWTTLIGYPIATAVPCLFGILVASATDKMIGKSYWNVWDVLTYMLEYYGDNSGGRFLVFLLAMGMMLSYLVMNLTTNSMPFGSDLSAMFPRWMTIQRGQVLCTLLGIAIVPWKLLVSAQAFLTFLSGYGYWLAPIAACMSVDYYWRKRGNLNIADLYRGDPTSRYWFFHGWNLRACISTVLALMPCLPSFAAQIAPNHLGFSKPAQNVFYISFLLTYTFAAVLYAGSYILFPEKNLAVNEKELKFELWADENDMDERNAMEAAAQGGAATPSESADEKDKDEDPRTYVLNA